MKNKFILAVLLCGIAFVTSAQTIRVPYPCTVPAAHDTITSVKETIRVPVYGTSCKKFLWLLYDCKTVITGSNDSVVTTTVKQWKEHDSTGTCYRDSVIPAPVTVTQFGAKITQGTFADQDKALRTMGLSIVRPNSINFKTWVPGSKTRLDDFLQQGYTCFVNIINDEENNTDFTKDTAAYRKKLVIVAEQYKAWKDSIYFVFENEVINEKYYTDSCTMTSYINLLRVAIDVFAKYNMNVVNGSVPAEIVNMMAGGRIDKKQERKCAKVDSLFAFERTITYKKYFGNVHLKITGDGYAGPDLLVVCDYYRKQSGHEVLTNEYHVEQATERTITESKAHWKRALVPYALIFDESRGKGGSITDGKGGVTKLGSAYAK